MNDNIVKVTIFKNVFDSNNPFYTSIESVIGRIKNGKTSKTIIEQISQEKNPEEQAKLKKQLPVICFSGEFTNRANAGITKHSGYICLDFDHLGEKLSEFRERVERDKYTFASFLSPRGDGLKVVVKIPPDIEKHSEYFYGLKLHFKEESLDDDCEIARCCFESYDPNIYSNKNSEVFDILIEPKVDIPIDLTSKENKIDDPHVVYYKIKKWAEKQQTYEDGNKHRFLVSISSACNRFGISQELTEQKIIEDYQDKASFVKSEDIIDIINKVYISYSNQFDISWFTDKGEMNDFNPTGPARDVIYLKSISQEIINSYHQGDSKGTTTYFKTIDEHWTWKNGELTLMGGIANHGKTTLMLQLCLIKSVREGVKWGIFSPEQNPPIDFYKDLIHTYIGKSTEPHHFNQMSKEELQKGMDFIHEHFYFLYPKDDSPTPAYINERFAELMIKHKIAGCITDPYNQLDNDYGKNGRDDIYISSFLSREKRFALDNGIIKLIIAHPKGNIMKIGKNYACPDVYDLAGGAMWNNKCDNILATYRPFYNEDKTNPMVEFRSQKIKKQKYVGIPGTSPLHFDIWSNRYLEFAEQREVTENGRTLTKWVGLSPFQDNYESEYQRLKNSENGNGIGGAIDILMENRKSLPPEKISFTPEDGPEDYPEAPDENFND